MRFNDLKLGRVAAVMLAATALQGSALYAQTTPDTAAPAPAPAKTHFGTFGVDLQKRYPVQAMARHQGRKCQSLHDLVSAVRSPEFSNTLR